MWDRSFVIRCPQLKSIYCGTVRLVVFRLPKYLYAASCFVCHFIIVQYVFVRLMYVNVNGVKHSYKVGTREKKEKLVKVRWSVLSLSDAHSWNLLIVGWSTACLLFSDCPNNYIFAVLLWNIQFDYSTDLCLACYFIIVQYVFVRFRYVDVNGSSIANVVQFKHSNSASSSSNDTAFCIITAPQPNVGSISSMNGYWRVRQSSFLHGCQYSDSEMLWPTWYFLSFNYFRPHLPL